MKQSRAGKVRPSDWGMNGFWMCARMKCPHLIVTILGEKDRHTRCYQKGGVHLYCNSEDVMAAGCCPPSNKYMRWRT